MITPLLQLNHSFTAVTPLPTSLLRLLQEPVSLLVTWTRPDPMPLPITCVTDLDMTPPALGKLPAIGVAMDVLGFDPLAASARRAVDPVARRELGVLSVPLLLEARVE